MLKKYPTIWFVKPGLYTVGETLSRIHQEKCESASLGTAPSGQGCRMCRIHIGSSGSPPEHGCGGDSRRWIPPVCWALRAQTRHQLSQGREDHVKHHQKGSKVDRTMFSKYFSTTTTITTTTATTIVVIHTYNNSIFHLCNSITMC